MQCCLFKCEKLAIGLRLECHKNAISQLVYTQFGFNVPIGTIYTTLAINFFVMYLKFHAIWWSWFLSEVQTPLYTTDYFKTNSTVAQITQRLNDPYMHTVDKLWKFSRFEPTLNCLRFCFPCVLYFVYAHKSHKKPRAPQVKTKG